jgi:hypothetical protein
VSKEDHRVVAEHVLRLGEAQCVRAGAGDAGGTHGSSGGGGATWRGRSMPARGQEGGGQGAGGHVARGKAAGAWHRAGEAAAVRWVEKQRRRRLEVDEGD